MIGLENGVVKLIPYQSEWKKLFEEERDLLNSVLADIIVEHIGSTSIPGIHAKPIIDIMVGVKDIKEGFKFIKPIEKLGYEYKGEYGIPGRLFFIKEICQMRTHHIHMVEYCSEFWNTHLFFRNYLIKNKDVARKYEKLKIELASKFEKDRNAYTEGKADFIREVLKKYKQEENNVV